MEARAAGRRLRRVGLGRADGARDGRRRHRRLAGHAGRRPALFDVPEERIASSTTGSTPTSTARRRRPTRWSGTGSTRPCRTCCSSGGSRARRASSIWSARSPSSRRGRRSCSAPARPTRRRSPPRWRRPSREAQAVSPNVHWIAEMVASRRSASSTRTRPCLLPLGLRAVRDHQPRGDGLRDARSSPAPSAASRRSSSTARPACWSRSSRRAAGRSSRGTRPPSSATWRPRINALMADEPRRRAMGAAGRRRAVEHFGWAADRAQDRGPLRVARPRLIPLGRGVELSPMNKGTNENAAGGRLAHPTSQIDPEHTGTGAIRCIGYKNWRMVRRSLAGWFD